jgi:hypothetical protein
MKALQPFPSIALGAFSEDLVTSRRVVIFGNALSGLAETLVERGARLVHVYDENPARVAEATARSTLTQVSFAPLGPGGIAARDGAFDVGFIDEVSQFATAASVVTRLRRALTARGVAFVSTVNPDKKLMYSVAPESANALEFTLASTEKPLSYYDLYDLVTREFDEVKMVGQTPFVGYALADFSPETDVEFSIDTALVPGGAEEPEFFIAVCSHFPITTESFCVVQMAAETLLEPLLPEAFVERASASNKTTSTPEVSPDVQRLHHQLAETQRLLTTERESRSKAEQLVDNVTLELQHRDAWVAELEKRAATADERADAAEAALERLESRAKQQPARVEDPQAQQRQAELGRQVASLTQVRRNLEADLARANESLAQAATTRSTIEHERSTFEHERSTLKQQRNALEHERNALEHERNALEQQRSTLEQQRSALEQQRSALEQERDTLKTQLEIKQAELTQQLRQGRSLAELEAKLATLETQNAAVRADLQLTLADLERSERQLASQGQEVRRLQTELADTERFAALLIAQREFESARAVDHLGNQGNACSGRVAAVSDTFTDVPGEAFERAEASAVVPEPHEIVATTESRVEIPTVAPDHEATLQALRWTIEELEQRLEAKSQEEALLSRLHAAQQQLQRQAVLLKQYEDNSSRVSHDSP